MRTLPSLLSALVATLAFPAAQAIALDADPAARQAARLWLGSYRQEDQAARGWAKLQRDHRDLLGRFEPAIVHVDLGPEKGIYFRLYSPLVAARQASETCQELVQRGRECLVVSSLIRTSAAPASATVHKAVVRTAQPRPKMTFHAVHGRRALKIARAARARGMRELTIQQYSRAIRSGALNKIELADAYRHRGQAYLNKHLFQRAIADLSKAIEMGDRNAGAYLSRGASFAAIDEPVRARADREAAAQLKR